MFLLEFKKFILLNFIRQWIYNKIKTISFTDIELS